MSVAGLVLAALTLSALSLSCRTPAAVAPGSPGNAELAQGPAALAAPGGIMIVYPKDGSIISAASTFLIGSCPAGSTLTCQGQSVKLSAEGYFAHVVSLQPGTNSFVLVRDGAPDKQTTLTVVRETPPPPVPAGALKFAQDSAQPKENLGLVAGDLVPLAIRATPGAPVEANLGKRRVVLRQGVPGRKSVFGEALINSGMETAYGRTFQRQSAHPPDLYFGFYRIQPDDHWQDLRVRFVVSGGRRSLKWLAPARLTTVDQPRLARTVHDDTVARLGPGQARTTPLPSGVRLLVDGWDGGSMRCLDSPGHHVWVAGEDLQIEDGSGPPPQCTVRTINVEAETGGARIAVPMSQRLPYQLEQQLNPARITLRIFGATADTDWITQTPPAVPHSLIDHVTWKQSGDRLYEVTAHLCQPRQWGFWAEYQGTNLLLHIKEPPKLAPGGRPLAGATVCLDPGHGGPETGAMGPSGIRESTVNLAIATQLKQLLEGDGARVIMTRTSEEENPSLADRVKTAIDAHADLLISVHNNALPDGRDPWAEHGTSSYWYHPQSLALAQTLKAQLISETGFPDFGTSYQNLALCRPSNLVATLVEVGFMINPDEYAQLIAPAFQQRCARALEHGVIKYLLPSPPAPEHPGSPAKPGEQG